MTFFVDYQDEEARRAYWREVYSCAENLVEIKFRNSSDGIRTIWVELAAWSIELAPRTEYKILSHDREFAIEFRSDSETIFWIERSFGFKLYRKDDANSEESWVLEVDFSKIN